jgi:hypothetical protein
VFHGHARNGHNHPHCKRDDDHGEGYSGEGKDDEDEGKYLQQGRRKSMRQQSNPNGRMTDRTETATGVSAILQVTMIAVTVPISLLCSRPCFVSDTHYSTSAVLSICLDRMRDERKELDQYQWEQVYCAGRHADKERRNAHLPTWSCLLQYIS